MHSMEKFRMREPLARLTSAIKKRQQTDKAGKEQT